ncbi:MAG: ferredoxin [Sedimentisphaeraceae bacterium JB056]
MNVKITDECINCGVCCDICPDVFGPGDEYAVVKNNPVDESYRDEVEDAADSCPTSAIIVD